MEYFLNYGGLMILGFLSYFFFFWLIPRVLFYSDTNKGYFLTVLAIHLLVGLIMWANYGLMLLGKN